MTNSHPLSTWRCSMAAHGNTPIILVPGFWLGAWAWDEVATTLREDGHEVNALTLPGLESVDADRTTVTFSDHVDAICEAVDAAGRPVVLAVHSGAGFPGYAATDRRPEKIAAMVYVDTGPGIGAMDPDFDGVEQPLPSPEKLAQEENLDGLSEEQLETFRRRAVPQPGGVIRETVELTNDARLDIPSTAICTGYTSEQYKDAVKAGYGFVRGFAEVRNVTWIDLPTSHWPMWSRPKEVAEIIGAIAKPPGVREVRPGVWHWESEHPEWKPKEPWRPQHKVVSSYAIVDDGRLLLFDPLAVPDEIEQRATGRKTVVVLTAPWHERDTESLVKRLKATVFAPRPDTQEDLMQKFGVTAEQAAGGSPDLRWLLADDSVEKHLFSAGDRLPIGIEVFAGREQNDVLLWFEHRGAVIVGDSLGDFGRGLEINPKWLRQGVTREEIAAGLRPLLERPVDVVLTAHSGPTDATAFERALS
jgi:pimeloyl-ACP methyl ester carboxylesterase